MRRPAIIAATALALLLPAVPADAATPSGQRMPTKSSRPGWVYSYGQDFNKSARQGSFDDVYGEKWAGYNTQHRTTTKRVVYDWSNLSTSGGMLHIRTGWDKRVGRFEGAAPFPQPPKGVNGGSNSYKGMRTTIRFKAVERGPGWKTAWMLWPSNWKWADGEIDFPEGRLNGTFGGFSHEAGTGHPSHNVLQAHTKATYSRWHTATTEWVPGKRVEFFLDGKSIGRTTKHVPTKPMQWVLQTEDTRDKLPARSSRGHVVVDWLTVERLR